MHQRDNCGTGEFRRALWLAAIMLAAGPLLAAERAKGARPTPQFNPQEMLERMFGEDSEEDQKALEKIQISFQEERQYSNAAVQAYLGELKRKGSTVVNRGKEVQYLKNLVELVRPLMTQRDRYRTIDVYLVRSPECEAKSFPGGSLVFYQGLLEAASNEAALVVVVGHELSHLDRGHQLVRAKQMKRAQQTFSGRNQAPSPERFFEGGLTMMRIWTRPFRPEDEATADRDGARWAYKLGYDPREVVRIFDAFAQRKGATVPLPSFLKSHPDPKAREKAVNKLYEELQHGEPKEHLILGKENLRQRVTASQRKLED